jgi:hypothetical protein
MSEDGYFAYMQGRDMTPVPAFKHPPAICTDPDRRPDRAGLCVESRGDDTMCVMNVKGHGAILLRVITNEFGELVFKGMSTFSQEQIRNGEL